MAPERSDRVTAVIRSIFLTLAITWASLIFYLSSQPGIDTPLLFPGQDKLFHLIAYAVLGFFVMGSVRPSANGHHTRQQIWFVVLLVMFYGISDEIHQYFVPGRSSEVVDALADALGGLLGGWVMVYLVRVFRRSSRMRSAPTDD